MAKETTAINLFGPEAQNWNGWGSEPKKTTNIDSKITEDPSNPNLAAIEAERTEATNGYNTTIDGVISNVDTVVSDQQAAIDESTKTLIDAQNDYTDATVGIIEGQKKEAREDYEDEARGAYVDWKLESDPFGANAEHMAANGLSRSGYSESSKVRMYQSYQNRKALAYKAFSKAITEYNNQITMARAQNSVTIAQIASDGIKEKAKIALEGFYYKNELIEGKLNKNLEINQYYDGKWQDELDRMQAQANWKAEFDQKQSIIDAEEEEEIIISPDTTDALPLNPPYPTLTTGNPTLDAAINATNPTTNPSATPPQNPMRTGEDPDTKYPDYPTLPNGKPAFLTFEMVGEDNIHTVDDDVIYETFGNISPEELNELVERGYVKEVFYKDKDGKIGMTFKVVHETTAKEYLESKKGGTNSSTNADATGWWTRLWESVANGIAYSGSGGSGWIR